MHYTPGQLRDAVGLSKEAFRHWKRVLPGFPSSKRHGPSFSPGDVLASAVLRRLTECCGLRIGQLTVVSRKIFDVCNDTSWEVLAERVLVVDLGSDAGVTLAKRGRIPGDTAVVLCPMAPVIAMLREDLVGSSALAAGRTGQGGTAVGRPSAVGRRHR